MAVLTVEPSSEERLAGESEASGSAVAGGAEGIGTMLALDSDEGARSALSVLLTRIWGTGVASGRGAGPSRRPPVLTVKPPVLTRETVSSASVL